MKAEGVLRQVQGQMVGKLGEKCEKEFDNIMAARSVVPKLNELEGLIADASQRRSASTTEPTPYGAPKFQCTNTLGLTLTALTFSRRSAFYPHTYPLP